MVASLRDPRAAIRGVTATLLLIAAACGASATDSTSPFEAAQQALRRGALDEALSHVAAASAAQPRSTTTPATRQLRLLEAEILLARPDVDGASAIVALPIPDRAEFAPLRARHRYVRARARGRPWTARTGAGDAGRLSTRSSPSPRTVRLDAGVLAGQALIAAGPPGTKRRHDSRPSLTTPSATATAIGWRSPSTISGCGS